MRRTRLKICCISSAVEAKLAVEFGADAIGLVAAMPSGPGCISDQSIAEIVRHVPPSVATVLLTCEVDPDAIVHHVRRTGVCTVQLVDDACGQDVWAALRRSAPAIRIVQVIHVQDASSVELAGEAAGFVDAILLDSGRPLGPVRELGGTGRTHDWSISRQIVRECSVPVFMAGGLNPANIGSAISQVGPFGVDVCSGVRTNGALDPALLGAFVEALQRADMAISPPHS